MQPTYSGYASPAITAPVGQTGSLKPEDEEEIAAALFDLAKTSRGARPGSRAPGLDDSLILPSSRKRPRKPSRAGIKYETNYNEPFDDDWDAEDEYLAKRRGTGRPVDTGEGGGYPLGGGYNPGGGDGGGNQPFSNGYQQPAPISIGARFKPGPNHVAISHFIQWHRRQNTPPPQQQQQQPSSAAPSSQAAALAAALARAQGGMRAPGGVDVSSIAALLPALQAGLRQGGAAGAGVTPAANPLAGMLGQLLGGQQQARGQMNPDAMNLLQQLIRRQTEHRQQKQQQQQPPCLPQHPNVPANFAAVLARLRNAQAKAQGVAMAAAATQSRPPSFQTGQPQQQPPQQQPALPPPPQQQQRATNSQSPAAVLQNLKALLTSNAQRAKQQGIPPPPPGQLPPSHTDLMKLMKQSLEIAKRNPSIGALVAKQQQQQQVSKSTPASVAPITISATPADTALPTIVASTTSAIIQPVQGKMTAEVQQHQQAPGNTNAVNTNDAHPINTITTTTTNPATASTTTAAAELASDQIKENVALPTSVPPFQPPPSGALDAMRAYLLQHKKNLAANEGGVDAVVEASNGIGDNEAHQPAAVL
jgi:hypothetical protein